MELKENLKPILKHWDKINIKISNTIIKALQILIKKIPNLLYLHGSCTQNSLKVPKDIDFIYISQNFNDFTIFQQIKYIKHILIGSDFDFPIDVIPYSMNEFKRNSRFDFNTYDEVNYPNKLILVYKNDATR